MGNRACVQFVESPKEKPFHEIYLHWNGGPESVLAFLETMINRGWTRMDYASARFTSVAIEFMDLDGDCSGLSVGILPADCGAAEYDNGTYIVSSLVPLAVTRNGKKINRDNLKGRDLEKYLGIETALIESRAKRTRVKGVQGHANDTH